MLQSFHRYHGSFPFVCKNQTFQIVCIEQIMSYLYNGYRFVFLRYCFVIAHFFFLFTRQFNLLLTTRKHYIFFCRSKNKNNNRQIKETKKKHTHTHTHANKIPTFDAYAFDFKWTQKFFFLLLFQYYDVARFQAIEQLLKTRA